MRKFARITPTQSNKFDEKFTEHFADYVSEHFFGSEHQIKKSLLTAALREPRTARTVTPSLVTTSMQAGFDENEIRDYHEDNAALELYLRNIDRIEEALLGATDKVSYKEVINESIATLRNVRDGSPKISLGRVMYGMGRRSTSKMIEANSLGYYEGQIGISRNTVLNNPISYSLHSIGMAAGNHLYKGNGKGVYTWADGDQYEGDFVDGIRTGRSVYTWVNGAKYEGDFVDGARTGKGVFTWVNGDRYEGDFVDNARTGNGVYTWADGDICKGEMGKDSDQFKDVVNPEDVDLGLLPDGCSSPRASQITNLKSDPKIPQRSIPNLV